MEQIILWTVLTLTNVICVKAVLYDKNIKTVMFNSFATGMSFFRLLDCIVEYLILNNYGI